MKTSTTRLILVGLAFLAITLLSGCANTRDDASRSYIPAANVGKIDEGGDAWTNSLPAFLTRLSTIIGERPVWPVKDPPGSRGFARVVGVADADGKTVFVIPMVYPMTGYPYAQNGTTAEFKGKTVVWDVTVKEVTNHLDTGRVSVTFQEPKLRDFHAMFAENFAFFGATLADSEKAKAAAIKAGSNIRLKAKLGFNFLEGVDLWFGVGKNSGTIQPYISLQEAVILDQ
jgi:hypothetical protein